jgi:hypothetical protein
MAISSLSASRRSNYALSKWHYITFDNNLGEKLEIFFSILASCQICLLANKNTKDTIPWLLNSFNKAEFLAIRSAIVLNKGRRSI